MENKQTILAEMEELAPDLASIGNTHPYQVPVGYFDQVPKMVMEKIAHKEESPIISMRYARRWMSYVAAAIMAGLLVTSAFLFSDKYTTKATDQYRAEDISLALDRVPDAELSSYLEENTNPSIEAIFTEHSEPLPSISVHMQSMSNENLDEYLLENNHLNPIGADDSARSE